MKNHKGYFGISKQRKKGCAKMALDDLWKQKKEKDRSGGEKTNESDECSFGAKYDRSIQFWSSFSRVKATAVTTNGKDKCDISLPFLEDYKNKDNDVRDKKDLSNTENIRKILKYSNKEKKRVHADTTSEDPKLSSRDEKYFAANNKISMKKMNKRRKLLLNNYKIERQNRVSTNKKRHNSNNASEMTPSNKTDKIQIPVQINKEKLHISSGLRLSEKKVKGSYYESETMEADSTVPNDKKDDTHIYNNKNINEHELCQTVIMNKLQKSFNVPMVLNQNDLNKKERKRKRIKQKFRYYFDECLTISEEEEEESILDLCLYKRQKNDFNETSSDSTIIESPMALDMVLSPTRAQNTTANIETCKIKKVNQIEVVSSLTSTVECNNVEISSDNDVFVSQNESPTHTNVHIEEIEKSTLLDNDEQIQTNLSNELQIKIVNYSSGNRSFNYENNVEENYVEKPSTLEKSIDTEMDALPDSNINNDNCNDTSIKVLTNHAIEIRTSNEENKSNNFDEITCVSQNSSIKESELNVDSGDSSTAAKVLNSTLDVASSVEGILESSKNTENQSETLQDHECIDKTEKRESVMVTNIHFAESHAKNINDSSVDMQIEVTPCTETSKSTVRNSDICQENINKNIPIVDQPSTKDFGEDLNQLLQIDVNQNHRIQSDGNTISIEEDLEKDSNLCVIVQDISINNVTSKTNEISSEEKHQDECSTIVTDINLTESIDTCNAQNKDDEVIPIVSDEEANLITNNNTIDNISPIVSDTSKENTLLDRNSENTNNFKQPEIIQTNKIRVLSSAELGSRWCPTPVNDSVSSSVTESKLSSDTFVELLKDNVPCKDPTKNATLDLNSIPDHVRSTLIYIYNIMMRIRSIEKKYLSNNYQNISTGNQKTLSNDAQFRSNFTVLLQEFVNLATDLEMSNMNKVVQYAILMINKHCIQNQCESMTMHELIRYMKLLNRSPTKSAAATPTNDTSMLDGQGTKLDNAYTATTKPIPSVSNNSNAIPVTLPFVPNVYVPITSQGHITSNNLPKQNVYVSNVSNQSHEYNISNVQAMQKPNTSISYAPPVQQTYTNMQLLPGNRPPNINMQYYQHLIPQLPVPAGGINDVPNANIMQLKNNVHVAQRVNMHKKPQENLIGNKPELLTGQPNIPQRFSQQTMPHNIPQVPQSYMAQNPKNTQFPSSATLPMHSSNIPPRTNTISNELIFKIWDQVAYCLEQNIVDNRLHNMTYYRLRVFYEKWKKPLHHFMYQKVRSKNNEIVMSQQGKLMYHLIRQEKRKQAQLLAENKKLQNESLLMNILNKTVQRKNLESPPQTKSQNETVRSEVTWHKLQKHKEKVEHAKQQQSQDQYNLQLLDNMVISLSNEILNASQNNNSVRVEPNVINSNNTMVLTHKKDNVQNVNVTTFTSSEKKIEKHPNMLKTNEITFSENDDIQILQDIHRKDKSLLSKQTIGEVVRTREESLLPEQPVKEVIHVREESLLPEQTIPEVVHTEKESLLPEQTIPEVVHTEKEGLLPEQTIPEVVHKEKESLLPEQTITQEIVHIQEESSLPEQTIGEVVHTEKESLLPEQTVTEEIVHIQEESSLPEQIVREVVNIEEESLLPEQTVTEEIVHIQEESSLPEQIVREVVNIEEESSLPEQTVREVNIEEESSLPEQTVREVVNVEEENLLPKQTIIEEVVHTKEESSLPEQTVTEVVQMEKESLLLEQTIEEAVNGKEQTSVIEQIIKHNNNYLQCDSIQSVTLLDPHIVDVRSISLTSFNKMENVFALNELQLPSNEVTENTEIKVKIEIPEDIICLQCSKTSTVVCEVCLHAHYCSKECAELHWMSEHHKDCKPFNLESSEKSDNDASTIEDTDFDVNHTNVA